MLQYNIISFKVSPTPSSMKNFSAIKGLTLVSIFVISDNGELLLLLIITMTTGIMTVGTDDDGNSEGNW